MAVKTKEEKAKEKVIKELTKAGIDFDIESSIEELKNLLPKKDSDSVTVTWNGGTRTYSKEVHGDDYEDLADEFVEKHNGTIVS